MTQKKLMAVGAHADDIEFNVGGTLLKYLDHGYDVVYVMSTNNMAGTWKTPKPDGTYERHRRPYDETEAQRKQEAAAAAADSFHTTAIHLDHPQRWYTSADGARVGVCYGAARPANCEHDRPTILTAHEHPEHVEQLAGIILAHQPEAVMTHGPVTSDIEHHGTCLLVSKAFRRAAEQGYNGMLLHWPDITVTLPKALFGPRCFDWDAFVDVTDYWQQKIDSISHHASVVPNPAGMRYPDWSATCGRERVEPFVVADWGDKPDEASSLALELIAHKR